MFLVHVTCLKGAYRVPKGGYKNIFIVKNQLKTFKNSDYFIVF